MKKPTEEAYTVVMTLRDGRQEVLLEDTDFKKCKEYWKVITKEWQTCHNDKQLFILEKPIVIAFEPGLIYQIELTPKIDPVANVQDDNPYKQQMQQQGLNQTLQGVGNFSQMLDEGFNR